MTTPPAAFSTLVRAAAHFVGTEEERQSLVDAAEHLARSECGRDALAALNRDAALLIGLDPINRASLLTLLQGLFGDYPGTVREILRAECEGTTPDIKP